MHKRIVSLVIGLSVCGSVLGYAIPAKAQVFNTGAATSSEYFNMPAQSYFQNPGSQQAASNISTGVSGISLWKPVTTTSLSVSGPKTTPTTVSNPNNNNWTINILAIIAILVLIGAFVYIFKVAQSEMEVVAPIKAVAKPKPSAEVPAVIETEAEIPEVVEKNEKPSPEPTPKKSPSKPKKPKKSRNKHGRPAKKKRK
jgi:hypothetical protein